MKYLKRFNESSEYSGGFNKEEFLADINELVVEIGYLGYDVEITENETSRQFEFLISIVNDSSLGKETELLEEIRNIISYIKNEGSLLMSLKTYNSIGGAYLLRDICVDETEIFRVIKDKKGINKEVDEIDIEIFKKKVKL